MSLLDRFKITTKWANGDKTEHDAVSIRGAKNLARSVAQKDQATNVEVKDNATGWRFSLRLPLPDDLQGSGEGSRTDGGGTGG